ncbi:DUF1254 domain-containing protein [Bizionia arctica]|uniref:DUF1254 domain-containing protein n=1 Tax=Bizionia arctica TaxID=1495645 RepID=A0A917LP19_9FLAO|nr:DUF1254 domain-containing protein [Bizionia arctica]GGG47200.1 hypothetical protein GCM10010976_18300 [Bizionia arctica]
MNLKNLMKLASVMVLVVTMNACKDKPAEPAKESPATLPLDSIKAIAHDAYIYGYPMVDNYRVEYAYYVDKTGTEFKAPWNQITNIAQVYTAADTAVQTANSDTPYSWIGYDVTNEPLIIGLPEIEESRYYDVQFVDSYTYNFAYLGSRTTGNKAGTYMLVGPNWKGETPEGIDKVIKTETQIGVVVFRTQLFNPADIDNVKAVQAKYKVQGLSEYLGKAPVAAASASVNWMIPLTPAEQKTSLEFFNVMNFVMNFCPTVPSEVALMERFAKIGVGAGKTIDVSTLSPDVKAAMEAGIKEAWGVTFAGLMKKVEAGEVTSANVFGTRDYIAGNYLYRMAGDVLGLYGNSKEEAFYPLYTVDADKKPLDAATNNYTLTFKGGDLPPVNAFWSLTMYTSPESLMVANPINRYLINSPMLSELKKNADGGITIYFQKESPGKNLESNWLPAPNGPFRVVLREYWPKPEAYNGTWKQPEIQLVK